MTTPLQVALGRRSIGLSELANVGIDRDRGEQLLNGADATVEELRTIAATFKIPIVSLFAESVAAIEDSVRLRENYSRDSLGQKITETYDLLTRARALSKFIPTNDRLDYWVELAPGEKTYIRAEELAAACRADILGAGDDEPLLELELHVATTTSAFVLVNQPIRFIEGATVSASGRRYIFVAPRNDPRMRFTLAHELCHYLVDVPAEVDTAWLDEELDRPRGDFRLAEFFANAFASALLVPPTGLGVALREFRRANNVSGDTISDIEVMFVARFFGVNFQVAARRLEDLKLLPSGAGQTLYEGVAKKHGSPEQFANSIGLPPRDKVTWGVGLSLLAAAASPSIDRGEVSVGKVAQEMGISVRELLKAANR